MTPPPPPLNEDARKTLLSKRFAAALIDGLIAIGIFTLFQLLHERLGQIACSLYLLFKDSSPLKFPVDRSLGKQLLNIRPILLAGGTMEPKTSALRNWPLALPMFLHAISGGFISFIFSIIGFAAVLGEIALLATNSKGHRFGDMVADTEVRSDV